MVEHIFLEGGEYISASRASQKIGYAADYIGQLCRAKKIPGQLVGRTWYVDFASLVEHKKNRKLGKRKKFSDSAKSDLKDEFQRSDLGEEQGQTLNTDFQDQTLEEKPAEIVAPKSSDNAVFTYENDDRPRLPELSKKGRFIKSPWNIQTVKEAVSLSLAVLVTAGVGLMTLERAAPPIAADFEQRVESISIAGEKFFAALPAEFIQTQQLATANAGQITASLFDGVNEFVGDFVSGFRHFKDIALSKIFLTPAVPQAKIPSVVVAENINGSKAVTEVSGQLSLETLKSELKTELENYVRVQIDSAGSPVVVYSSSPALALAELASFKTNEVVPAIYYSVTRQSNADSSRSSSHIGNLTDGGSFSNATIKGATIYDSTGGFSTLAFTTATGTSATTTNFFATNAEFTNLISTGQTITNLTFTIATGTSATTTNLYVSGRASSTDLRANTSFLGNLTSTFASFTNALFNGSTTLQNFTAQNSTSTQATTTNFAISGLTLGSIPFVGTGGAIIQNNSNLFWDNANTRLGLGTTTPFTLLQVATTSISSTFKSQFTLTDIGGGTNAKHWNLTSVGGDLRIGTSSDAYATSTYFTIKNGGNIGVGTTSPYAKLSVTGSGTGTGAAFTVADSANTPRLTVLDNGNVGIGTAGPTAGLHIQNLSADITFRIEDAQANTTMQIYNSSAAGGRYDIGVGGTGSAQPGGLYVYDGTNIVTRLVLNSSGNLGIGTTTPQWKNQISTTAAPQLTLSDSGLATANHWTFRNSNGILYFATSSPTSFATSTTPALTIDGTTGNVGIGTTSPWGLLSVNPNGIAGPAFVIGSSTQCVTGDTLLKRRRRRKNKKSGEEDEFEDVRIDQIKEGDEILTLDENTGRLLVSRVNKLMNMGVKPIVKITTGLGRTIRTTAEHPYLAIAEDYLAGKFKKPHDWRDFGRVFIAIDAANLEQSVKDRDWWIDYRRLHQFFSTRTNLAGVGYYSARFNTPSQDSFLTVLKRIGFRLITKPLKFLDEEARQTEHTRKANFDVEIVIDAIEKKNQFDTFVLFSGDSDFAYLVEKIREQGKKVVVISSRYHIARELIERADIFVDIKKMKMDIERVGWKTNNKARLLQRAVDDRPEPAHSSVVEVLPHVKDGVWTKVKSLREGQEIAVLDKGGKPIWDKIEKIERLSAEEVYDIEVEGTHNFIGNDIVAHNTYLTVTNGGNVGIGTVNPNGLLDVQAAVPLIRVHSDANNRRGDFSLNSTGELSIASAGFSSANSGFITLHTSSGGAATERVRIDTNGNVGIGDTSPDFLLETITSFAVSNGADGDGNRFLVNSSGNVGIGTTTPQWKNQISTTAAPQLTLSDSGLATANHWSFRNSNGTLYFATSSPTSFATSTTPALTINGTTGYVGVGTANPGTQQYLHIVGSETGLNQVGVRVENSSTGRTVLALLTDDVDVSLFALGTGDGSGAAQLFVTTNDALSLGTNNTDRILILAGGNVGINDSSADAMLDVVSGAAGTPVVRFEHASSPSSDYVQIASSGGSGGNILTINSSGNVGIGTTSPISVLDVFKASGDASASFTASSTAGVQLAWTIGTDLSDSGKFKIASSTLLGLNDRFVIDGSGNVGIGTASPGTTLHVATKNVNNIVAALGSVTQQTSGGEVLILGQSSDVVGTTNGNAAWLIINHAAASGAPNLLLRSTFRDNADANTNFVGSRMIFNKIAGANSSNIDFSTTNAGVTTDRMRIDSSGNLGLGTTTPFTLLQVATTSISSTFKSQFTLTDNGGGTNAKHWNLTSVGGDFRIGTSSDAYATSTYLTIKNGGNTGVGTTSPYAKLSVTGSGTGTGAAFTVADSANTPRLTVLDNGNVLIGGTTERRNDPLGIETSDPGWWLWENDQGDDGKLWDFFAQGGLLSARLVNDSNSAATNWLLVERSGTTVTDISFPNGNLGIGTTSPQWKTQISATAAPQLTLSDSGLATANHWSFRNSNGQLYFATSSPTSFATSTTPALTIDGTIGRVGIGNAGSFANRLSIQASPSVNSGGNDGLQVGIYGTASGDAMSIRFSDSVNSNAQIGYQDNATAASRLMWLTADDSTRQMVLTNAGNLGIGTTTPFTLLQIATTSISSTFKSQFTLTDNGGGTNAKHWNLTSVGGDLRIGTSSDAYATSTYLTIKNGGNVGIGTTSPFAKLAINPVAGDGDSFVIGSSTATSFVVNNVGNVGIGTANPSPAAKLWLKNGASGVTAASTDNYHDMVLEDDDNVGIIFRVPDNNLAIIGFGNPTVNDDTKNYLVWNYNGGNELFNINLGNDLVASFQDGNKLGIATTTSNNKLDIYSTTKSAIGFSGASGDTYKWTLGMDVSNGGRFSIASSTALGTTDRLVIDGSGNVGIGTGVPTEELEIQSATPAFELQDTTDNGNMVFLNDADRLQVYVGGTEKLSILENGNLGIGQTNPQQKLTVAGSVGLQGIDTGAGTAYLCTTLATGVVSTSTSACNGSSLRYKENIEDISYGLADVLKLRPVSFDYKPELLVHGHQVGFLAEDVYGVVPEVVGFDKEGRPDNIDYAKLTSVLTRAVQELNLNVETIASTTASSTLESQSFATSFFSNLFARVTAWLAIAGNGIGNIFAKTISTEIVYTKELCIDDICITKTELKALLELANTPAQADTSPSSDSSQLPASEPTSELTPEIAPTEEPVTVVEPEPVTKEPAEPAAQEFEESLVETITAEPTSEITPASTVGSVSP